MARLSSVLISLLLLACLAAAVAAADSKKGGSRVSARYASEEEARWLNRWEEKYQSAQGSGSGEVFKIQPSTDEESAQLKRMFPGVGYMGHIEYDDDHPFGRIVVDAVHSRAPPSKPNDDLKKQEGTRAEYDIKDL